MKISIIIPVINEAEQIGRSIDRAWASGADQVVVVDGGSSDDTRTIASKANCVLETSAPGRAIQMNRGADRSDGDVLVFLHADNWLADNACTQIRNAIAHQRASFGAFEQQIQHDGRVYRWIETGNLLRAKWQGLIYGDQALFIRSDLFEQVGRFPEIELMEDYALSRKLRKIGKPVILSGPTYVSSRRWETAGAIRQTARNWFLSTAYRMGASPRWLASRYRRHDRS